MASTDGQDAFRALWLDWGNDPNSWHFHFGVSSYDDDVQKGGGQDTLGNVPDPTKPSYQNYGSGCGLYAQAHAIQWLNQQATSDPSGLIETLLYVPNGGSPWDSAYNGSYNELVCQLGNATLATLNGLDENRMYQILTSGGVVTMKIPGHYFVAVGAEIRGSKTWYHIVDSNCRSTMDDLHDEAYKFDWSGTAGLMSYAGGEYWISHDNCRAHGIEPLYAFLPKDNIDTRGYYLLYSERAYYQGDGDRHAIKVRPYANNE